MPTKRQSLDLLTADEIAPLFQHHRVNVRGRSRAHLLGSLEEKGPDLATLLASLLRPRLAELCAALGVSEGPKDTWLLVERLSAVTSPAPAGPYGTPSPGNTSAAERYAENRFSVTRQLRYSRDETQRSLDLALFVNGLPVATFELKNSLTK